VVAGVGERGEYERRRPELTVLYEAVERGWPSVQESLPERIREEVRRFLECGLLRYGFLEVKCEECRQLSLIAFSCKKRGWCPACTTRRAVEVALRLSAQLPFVAHRQWTLSLPRGLRLAVVKQPRVLKLVERALVRAVWRWQRAVAKRLGVTQRLQGGAVAFTQWFSSALALTPHLHVLLPEVLWTPSGEVVELPPPDDEEVEGVLRRLLLQLKAVLAQVEGALPEDEYEGLQAASVQGRMELGDARRPEAKKRRVALGLGFSLHADTAAHGNDREGLARLCRYASRGPVAEERLQRLPDGRYQYATKKGAVLVLTAHALVKRLVALVPPARVHLTSSHGVYAANARLRPVVLQPQPQSAAPAPSSVLVKEEAPDKAKPRRPPRLDWATLQAKTFGTDVWKCPRCGGRRRVVGLVTSRQTAEELLMKLGLLTPRRLLPPERGPPQLQLSM
jgi:hypothetical protein